MFKKTTAAIWILFSGNVYADTYNNISIQGQLTSPEPIYGVTVAILSGETAVWTGEDTIDLIPDATNFVFSTQTYITDPGIFKTGSDYTMRLSTGTSPIVVISTFGITAVPFALTVRGDAQTGNQNIFAAYGNVGIGTGAPAYRLEVSSAAGSSDDIVVVSTGGKAVIRMNGAGAIYANQYYGDGSQLTGITGVGDNLGNHTATDNLLMSWNNIYNVSTITASGNITAASYQINGARVVGVSPNSVYVGRYAGESVLSGNYNTMVGDGAGKLMTSGDDNVFMGYSAGVITEGDANTFLGTEAGELNTSGEDNVVVGFAGGAGITSGRRNAILGSWAGFSTGEGRENSYYGYRSGAYSTGSNNTFIGFESGLYNTVGSSNIVIGSGQNLSAPAASAELNIGGVLFGNLADKTLVVSTGTASNIYAQIWRNGNGVIVSSVSSTGVVMASRFVGDGSGLTGLAGSGDVYRASTQTFTGQNTFYGNTYFPGSGIWNASGNVGIGTGNPTQKLEVKSTSTHLGLEINSPSAYSGSLRFSDSGSAKWLISSRNTYDTPNYRLGFYVNGVDEKMTLLNSGNVGIGVTNPTAKLEVNGDSKFSSATSTSTFSGWVDIGLHIKTNSCTGVTSCSVTCDSGERVLGGGCAVAGVNTLVQSFPAYNGTWACYWGSSGNPTAYALCARVK